ncbi:MAG TPA: hypothetical protein VF529_14290 [Solirubrobacteraceae bacterium]|jgi:hypothetical protein
MDQGAAGQFWFDPATMMLRRAPRKPADALVRGMELNHERAHWYQFAGSTVGALLCALHRAEHILIYAFGGPGAPAHASLEAAVARQRVVGEGPGPAPPRSLDALGKLVAFVQRQRQELLRSEVQPDAAWQERWTVGQVLATLTYKSHTGYAASAQTLILDLDAESISAIPPAPAGEPATLSTLHVLEAGARLSEWLLSLAGAWRGADPGNVYVGLTPGSQAYIADRLRFDADLYRRCFDAALAGWDEPLCLARPREAADAIARWLPTLLCCVDIALNPRVQPISVAEDIEAHSMHPGIRFERAAEAAAVVGRLTRWPTDETYAAHRDEIAETAGLALGFLGERSVQHERFDATFWTEAEASDDLVVEASHFDYLVWAIENMQVMRRDRPFQWALPGLRAIRQGAVGADVRSLIDPQMVWINAPLYWVGDEWEHEVRLSEAVASALVLDVAAWAFIKQALSGRGVLTLDDTLPPELACDSEFLDAGRTRAAGIMGSDELMRWGFEIPVSSERVDERPDVQIPQVALPELERRIEIERADVEDLQLAVLADAFKSLRCDPMAHRWTRELAFNSYYGDPRELYDIPDVTRYLRAFTKTHPDWSWYFRPPLPGEITAGFTLCCLAQLANPREATEKEWQALALQVIGGFNFAMNSVDGVDPEADWAAAAEVIKAAMMTVSALRLN